jgi:hypothetical protein
VVTILVVGFLLITWRKVLPVLLPALFTVYLAYGFIRPRLSRKLVHEIEDQGEDDEDEDPPHGV